MGAFIMYGITPGPTIFQTHPTEVWGLVASMYVGNVMLLVLNLPLVGILARILRVHLRFLVRLIHQHLLRIISQSSQLLLELFALRVRGDQKLQSQEPPGSANGNWTRPSTSA